MPAIMTRHLGQRTAAKLFAAGFSFERNTLAAYHVVTPTGPRDMSLDDLFETADAL